MIIDAKTGTITNRQDLTQVIVYNYSFRVLDNGQEFLTDRDVNLITTCSTEGFTVKYNQIDELKFQFEDGRLVIYASGFDITCDMNYLNLIFRKLNPTYTITTTSQSMTIDSTNTQMLMNVLEDCIINVNDIDSRMNGVRDVLLSAIREMAFNNIPLYPGVELMSTMDQLVWCCFPLARFFSEQYLFKDISQQFIEYLEGFGSSNKEIKPFLFSNNLNEVSQALVGCNSKTVIKYLAENSIHDNKHTAKEESCVPAMNVNEVFKYPLLVRFKYFETISALSDIFCLDHVHELMGEYYIKRIPSNLSNLYNENIDFFNRFGSRKLLNLFKAGFTSSDISDISDTIRQYDEYKTPQSIPEKIKEKYPNGIRFPKRFKTFVELHNNISRQYREIKAQADNVDILYNKVELKLSDAVLVERDDEYRVILPFEGVDLVGWGSHMNNCIAGYGKKAANKEVILIAILKNKEMIYNIEAILNWQEFKEDSIVLSSVEYNHFMGTGKDNNNQKVTNDKEMIMLKDFIRKTLLEGDIIASKEDFKSSLKTESNSVSLAADYIGLATLENSGISFNNTNPNVNIIID